MPGSRVRVPPLLSSSQPLGSLGSSGFSFDAQYIATTPLFFIKRRCNALPPIALLTVRHESAVHPRRHHHVLVAELPGHQLERHSCAPFAPPNDGGCRGACGAGGPEPAGARGYSRRPPTCPRRGIAVLPAHGVPVRLHDGPRPIRHPGDAVTGPERAPGVQLALKDPTDYPIASPDGAQLFLAHGYYRLRYRPGSVTRPESLRCAGSRARRRVPAARVSGHRAAPSGLVHASWLPSNVDGRASDGFAHPLAEEAEFAIQSDLTTPVPDRSVSMSKHISR